MEETVVGRYEKFELLSTSDHINGADMNLTDQWSFPNSITQHSSQCMPPQHDVSQAKVGSKKNLSKGIVYDICGTFRLDVNN